MGRDIVHFLCQLVDLPIDVAPQESDVLCDVHLTGAVLFAQLAEQTREDGLYVLQDLAFQAGPDVAKELPGKEVEADRAQGRALAAMHARGSVKAL
jgi:hypothetical protein